MIDWIDESPVARAGQPPMPPDEVLRLAVEIVSAMAAAHAKGIIHRDVKPANILVSGQGVAKLLEFGSPRSKSWWIAWTTVPVRKALRKLGC